MSDRTKINRFAGPAGPQSTSNLGPAKAPMPGRPSHGSPLNQEVRTQMEARFGHDFGSVRVHTDHESAASALDLNAKAYTLGADMVFGAGEYRPESEEGQRLIAHELAHVVQQSQGGSGAPSQSEVEVSHPDDPAEREAEDVAEDVMAGESASVETGHGPSINRMVTPDLFGGGMPSMSGIAAGMGEALGGIPPGLGGGPMMPGIGEIGGGIGSLIGSAPPGAFGGPMMPSLGGFGGGGGGGGFSMPDLGGMMPKIDPSQLLM